MTDDTEWQRGRIPKAGWYTLRWRGREEGPQYLQPVDSPEWGYFVVWGHDEHDDPETVKALYDDLLDFTEDDFPYMELEWRPDAAPGSDAYGPTL